MSDKTIEELIAASSFGTPEALAVRRQTDPALVAAIVTRSEELSARSLHVYREEADTVIAYSIEDAKAVWAECCGEPYDNDDEHRGGEDDDGFSQVPDDQIIRVHVDDPSDLKCGKSGDIAMTAAEWCAAEGRCFLCSENF